MMLWRIFSILVLLALPQLAQAQRQSTVVSDGYGRFQGRPERVVDSSQRLDAREPDVVRQQRGHDTMERLNKAQGTETVVLPDGRTLRPSAPADVLRETTGWSEGMWISTGQDFQGIPFIIALLVGIVAALHMKFSHVLAVSEAVVSSMKNLAKSFASKALATVPPVLGVLFLIVCVSSVFSVFVGRSSDWEPQRSVSGYRR